MSEQEYIDICALLGVEAWLQGWALWHTWDQQSRRITMVSTMVSATEGMLLTWSKGHHVMPVKPPRAAVAATVKGWLGPAIRSPGYAAETGVTEAVTASASPHLTGGSTAPGDRSQGLSRVEQTRQAAPGYRPRVSLTDADIASALASAGLQFVERVHGDVRDPLPPGKGAATCGDEDGRFDSSPDEIVDVHDPDFVAKVNAGWWRMASEYGLLDGQREFLLAVDYSEPEAIGFEIGWARVRLLDEWDLAGSGIAALKSYFATVFTDRFVPEFTMLSLDGRMLLNTTVWGNGTVSTIVIRPDCARAR